MVNYFYTLEPTNTLPNRIVFELILISLSYYPLSYMLIYSAYRLFFGCLFIIVDRNYLDVFDFSNLRVLCVEG